MKKIYIYIYIGHKLFRLYSKNKFRIKYKGLTFKFYLNESKIKVYKKVYKKEEIECRHGWSRIPSGMRVKCSKCGTTKNIDYYVNITNGDYCCAYKDGIEQFKADKECNICEYNNTFNNTDINGIVYIEAKNLNEYNCLFNNCKNITEILFNENYEGTKITQRMFCYCSGLETITIPNSVTTIGKDAFSDCISLKTITIGESVTTIENYAFSGCFGLTSLTIPNSEEISIGNNAFYYCSNLTSITIPYSEEISIGEDAFRNCPSLKTIIVKYVGFEPEDSKKKEYEQQYSNADLNDNVEFEW